MTQSDPRLIAFRGFHANNPHVYAAFKQFALQAAERRSHYSARDIIHRVRWWSSIESNDPDGWKINNNWSPFYARLFERDHPELTGFFERRRSVADEV